MIEPLDIASVVARRRLTRAVADLLRGLVKSHLASLGPLFHPRNLLGHHIRGESKLAAVGADKAFQELQAHYQALVKGRRLTLPTELSSPLDVFGGTPDVVPSEYSYTPAGYDKSLAIVTPLRWVLSYKDLGPGKIRELLGSKSGSAAADLQSCIVHNFIMHTIASRKPGVSDILDALRFPVSFGHQDPLAELPVVFITCPITTSRPPDEVLVQSAELSGTLAFEELVDVDDIANLSDPLKDQLTALVQGQA